MKKTERVKQKDGSGQPESISQPERINQPEGTKQSERIKQTERIERMERHLDLACQAVMKLSAALEQYAEAQESLQALSTYYGSEDWKQDLADDEAGRLPSTLKRGVLSEDGIWNLLSDNKELEERMREVEEKIKELEERMREMTDNI